MSDKTNATDRNVTGRAVNALCEEEIDLNLIGSFPASDPPSWTLGVDTRARTDNTTEVDVLVPAAICLSDCDR